MDEEIKTAVHRHFDDYAPRWHDRLQHHPFAIRFEAVRDFVGSVPASAVLDVGCGTGDYCQLFDPAASSYLGVDLSERMIEQCRSLYPTHAFEVGDAHGLAVESASKDLVLDIAVIEYYQDPLPHMRELGRVLKPGGYVVMAVPNGSAVTKPLNDALGRLARKIAGRPEPNSGKSPLVHHRSKTTAELAELGAAAGLRLVQSKYVYCMILPEILPGVASFNIAVSRRISGKPFWKWISRWSSLILVVLFRKEA